MKLVYPTSINYLLLFLRHFEKIEGGIIEYKDCKHFDNNQFTDELIWELSSNNVLPDDFAQFTNISQMILEKKTPLKERYIRYNQATFINKNLQKQL